MFGTRKFSMKPGVKVNNSCGRCPRRTRDGVIILICYWFVLSSRLTFHFETRFMGFRACRLRQTYAHVCNNFLNKVGEGMVLIKCDGPEKGSWLDQWCPASNGTTAKVFNIRSWCCFLHSLEEEGRLLNFKAGLKLQKTTFWG